MSAKSPEEEFRTRRRSMAMGGDAWRAEARRDYELGYAQGKLDASIRRNLRLEISVTHPRPTLTQTISAQIICQDCGAIVLDVSIQRVQLRNNGTPGLSEAIDDHKCKEAAK